MSIYTIPFKDIAAVALPMAGLLVPVWLPHGRREGREYVALNPRRADKHLGSFRINLLTGKWADFACDARGGDLIALYAYVHNVRQREALLAVTQMIRGDAR